MEKTKAEKMYALVDQWKESGKTQKVFCGEHDIKVGTFGWIRINWDADGAWLPGLIVLNIHFLLTHNLRARYALGRYRAFPKAY